MRIELARVQAQGWAASDQLLEPNYRSIAVPLRDRHSGVLVAPSVTMPMGHEPTEAAAQRVLGVLRETTQAMRNLF
jgi:IclR family pca regulon transcriptional regulator